MINWNEVAVGETEICRGSFNNRKVMGMCDPWVWLYDQTSAPSTYHKDDLHAWTIYDPWEDVSDECEFDDHMHVLHNGRYIGHELVDGGEYRRGPGIRVWKRKDES